MNNNTYYLPERVKKTLSAIYNYPATVVEAPSGFGKTTAVREYLITHTFRDTNKYWHTCLGEPIEKSWNAFCTSLANFNEATAGYLKRLGIPTDDNLADVADAMRRCDGKNETYIIIDNFQYMYENLPDYIIDALASHNNPKLHIIFLTQPTGYPNKRKMQNENIFYIGSKVLSFTISDTGEYLEKNGIILNKNELSNIYKITEGWIAALNLQRVNYSNSGKFDKSVEMDDLIKSVIWNHLSDKEKKFLLSVSVFDSFTFEQARIMSDKKNLPEYALSLLDTNAFIRYDKVEKEYILHALLRSYLRQEFERLSDSRIKDIRKLEGIAYQARGLNYPALTCFLKIEDYDSILRLPIRGDEFTAYVSVGSIDALTKIVNDCPRDTLVKYPKQILVIAFELFMTGSREPFIKLCKLLTEIIQNKDEYNINDNDYKIIAGEFARLESFLAFNDIEKMSAKHREALALLGGPATLYDWRDSWTFGQPSIFYLFWSKSGELNQELNLMDECLPYYYELTYGHGTGAESLMRAEAHLMEGDDKAAEILCHKALYMASGKDQDSICYGSELVLARIAMLRGDSAAYNIALDNMNKRLLEGKEPGGQKIVDLAHTFLQSTQGIASDIDWMSDLDQIKKNLYPVASFYGIFVYLNSLLINREFAAITGLSEPLLAESEKYNFLLPRLYILILTAISRFRLEEEDGALEALDQALEMALSDKVYMPFAEHGAQLEPLLKQRKKTKGVSEIITLAKRLDQGIHTIKSEKSEKPVLTQREKEVAGLAAQGLTNTQIAAQLFVSVNTIKVLLKRVFAKLNIKSRAQLSDFL